jgi:hypothetical protein
MHWTKEHIERFFGAPFIWVDPFHEMRFEASGIRYLLWIDEQKESLFLRADTSNPDSSFPAFEIGCQCKRIEETEAIGVGPVLHFYASREKCQDYIRLCVTRTRGHSFSLSPHWPQYEPAA